MRKLFLIVSILPLISFSQFVKVKKQKLYDVYEEPTKIERIVPTIFDDSQGTMWAELEDCGSFEITDEVKAVTGRNSIKISWDKSKGCEWIGFGNSFTNWAPTDMSQERHKKAFSMYVRTQKKFASAIPIVLAMEDAGGGGSYHFIYADRYLRGLNIDTTWRQVIVPLWDFPIREDEVDIYSIRQMQFQLEGGGSYYLDDLKIIDYTKEEYAAMREEVEAMKPKGNPNQKIYDESNFEFDAWGVGKRFCYELTQEKDSTSNTYIKWTFDTTNCGWNKWGINWNNWYQANFRGIEDISELKFKVKTEGTADFDIILQDFRYNASNINSKTFLKNNSNDWVEISIPLSDFELKEKGFAIDQIRELSFEAKGKGTIYLDDIEIREIK